MRLELKDVIGSIAAVLTTAAFIPQVVHSYRERDSSGVSLLMYALFTLGVFLWLVYGLILGQWPIIAANSVTLVLAAAILWMRWRT
jgi:MtN3 and saliva related transmembrane protein